jgi:hypothetical protein
VRAENATIVDVSPSLDDIDARLLTVLAASGPAGVAMSELGKKSGSKPSRAQKWERVRRLAAAGQVEILKDAPRGRKARITARGVETVAGAVAFGPRARLSGSFVNGLLKVVRGAPARRPAAAAVPADLRARLLGAIERLEPETGRLVPIHRLRAVAANGVGRATFDETLRALEGEGKVWLQKITDPSGVTDDQRRDSLLHGWTGDLLFFIKRRTED